MFFDVAGRHPVSFLTLTNSHAFISKVDKGLDMAKKTYYEKLKDPRWQKKRLEVMEHNEFACEVCGDNESPLNVHHKEYFKGQEPWEYEIRQLSCLCEDCHEETHDNLDILKFVCSYLYLDGPANREEVAFLIGGYSGIEYKDLLSVSCLNDMRGRREAHKTGVKAKKIYSELVRKAFLKEVVNNG